MMDLPMIEDHNHNHNHIESRFAEAKKKKIKRLSEPFRKRIQTVCSHFFSLRKLFGRN
jgi:hypothetical protein